MKAYFAKGKATGSDNIADERIEAVGEFDILKKGSLPNEIHRTGFPS